MVEGNLKEQIKTNARTAMGGMGMGGMNMGMALGMQGPPQMPKTAPKATAGGSPADGTRKKERLYQPLKPKKQSHPPWWDAQFHAHPEGSAR